MATSSSIAASMARETATAQKFETTRNVGGNMGKHDFLMLLVAQLRHQNPLEPTNDQDFGAQLAQFSQLEQLENMNQAMSLMALQQSYSLIGKFVVGEATIHGVRTEVFGIVESIFTKDGVTYAQLEGYDFGVPISELTSVHDSSDFVNPRMLIEISNSLIGREVKAEYRLTTVTPKEDEDEEDEEGGAETVTTTVKVEGVVTRVFVDGGAMLAVIVDKDGKEHEVPVGGIYDIGQISQAAIPKAPQADPASDPADAYQYLVGSIAATNFYVETVDGTQILLPFDENAPYYAEQLKGEVLSVTGEEGAVYVIIRAADGYEWKLSIGSILGI